MKIGDGTLFAGTLDARGDGGKTIQVENRMLQLIFLEQSVSTI